MSVRREGVKAVGVGAALCVACCAGPVVAWLAAIGLFTVAGVAWLGAGSLLVGAMAVAWVLRRRRRSTSACVPHAATGPVLVELSSRATDPRP